MTLTHHTTHLNGVDLHYVIAGEGDAIFMLHGFPANWYVWKTQLHQFGQHYRAIAIDGRGVNLSSKPDTIADYHVDQLVQDVIALADRLKIETFTLIGQDWGGSVAWRIAREHPERVNAVIVMNAPPLDALLYALATIPEQRTESAYMSRLKADGAEHVLMADDCAYLWQVSFAEHQRQGIYSEADRKFYTESWQQDGAVRSFLHWYRANLPDVDDIDADRHAAHTVKPITVPALLLWGEHEKAFTPQLLDLIPQYVRQLKIVHIAGADHWIMLEQPDRVYELVQSLMREVGVR